MTLSLPNLEQENFINTIFKYVMIMFKNGSNVIANKLIIELIHTLKLQNNQITQIREEIYSNTNLALNYDNDNFYDSMEEVEQSLDKLLKETMQIKEKSEMLSALYDIVDELYTNIVQLNYQVSSIVAEIEHKQSQVDKIAS